MHVGTIKVFDAVTINATAVVTQGIRGNDAGGNPLAATANMIRISSPEILAIFYTVAGATPDIKIEPVQWYGNVIGSAIQSSEVDDIAVAAAGSDLVSLSMPICPWLAFKVTGNAGNGADTTVSIWLITQEGVG